MKKSATPKPTEPYKPMATQEPGTDEIVKALVLRIESLEKDVEALRRHHFGARQ